VRGVNFVKSATTSFRWYTPEMWKNANSVLPQDQLVPGRSAARQGQKGLCRTVTSRFSIKWQARTATTWHEYVFRNTRCCRKSRLAKIQSESAAADKVCLLGCRHPLPVSAR